MNLSSSLNLASQTSLEKEESRKIKTILQFLIDHGDSAQFRQPVDWQGLGLLDYRNIVKAPMDLGTVSNKLSQQQYRFVEQVLDDIQLIWDNCKSYNQAGSWIYNLADKMDKYYKKLIKNYFSNVIITQAVKTTLTTPQDFDKSTSKIFQIKKRYDRQDSRPYLEQSSELNEQQKIKFIDRIKRLSPQNMGIIVEMIMQNCPKAYQYIEEDKCNIFIQSIDPALISVIKNELNLIENRRMPSDISIYEQKMTKRIKL